MTPQITAVDHFAGLGWGVACHALGIREYGVEKAKEAIWSRSANEMRTIYRDVWSGLFHPSLVPAHRLYIASPPCQTFSMAGNGEGREALDDVLTAIDDRRWTDAESLFELTEIMDPRTALVLTPLAHVWAHRPVLVALEQVPEVLPVWHAIAAVLRTLGYSVWTGILRAEQFGVPQTRKRAILMARLDGKVEPPVPTHSRYYSTNPARLDPGVEKWVSMAEALGWGMTERPSLTVTSGGAATGGYEPFPTNARKTMERAQDAGAWEYREAVKSMGAGMVERHGERPSRSQDEPAFTIRANAGGSEPGGFKWVVRNGEAEDLSAWGRTDIPAPTVAGDSRLPRRAFRKNGERQMDGAIRLTRDEAATLQSFPSEFEWRGSKTKQFLQIGNAVPPLMGAAILSALLAEPGVRDAWDLVFAEVAG